MNWTRAADLRAQVQKQWDRGALLSGMAGGEAPFPMRLALKSPTSAEVAERFDAVRDWIAELKAVPHCRLEMREFRHRVFGNNALPAAAWIDSQEDAASLIGKGRALRQFAAMVAATQAAQPALLAWLRLRPLRALELEEAWPKLLDIVLPAEAIDANANGVAQFARRYGFRDKPLRVRLRMLDRRHALLNQDVDDEDVTLDTESFVRLQTGVSRVFITENETNFLAFPNVADSLILFGAGYGFEMLGTAPWLSRCSLHYWGDIDTHGFAILDQLRDRFGHVESFLMDRQTLMAFEAQWGEENAPTQRELVRLTPAERALYDDLRDNRIRKSLRLEQERVGYAWVEDALGKLG
jgi:hypothetical protein